MFEQALVGVLALPYIQRAPFWARLDALRKLGENLGYGVGEEMSERLEMYAVSL